MNKNKGITLVSLVVTIIILLILAGISISTIGGKNGLFNVAKKAREEYKINEAKEEIIIAIMNLRVEEESKGDKLDKEDLPRLNNDKIDDYIASNRKIKENKYSFVTRKEYKDKRRKQMLKLNANGEISKKRNMKLSCKEIVRINPENKDILIFPSKTEGAESVKGSIGAISVASKNGSLSLIKGFLWINKNDFDKFGLENILDKYKNGEDLLCV